MSITSAYQRTALAQLAIGADPLTQVDEPVRASLTHFIEALREKGLLNQNSRQLSTPLRSLADISESDIAINQMRERSAPELAQSEWIDGSGDGGTSIVAARALHPIELSGRSRVITILFSLLLASGVSRVRFADRYFRPAITNLDISFGTILTSDLGGNYYEVSQSRRRELSLFPIDRFARDDLDISKPLMAIHYGDCDPEQLVEWAQNGIAHSVIHSPMGDEIVIGPLVLPGKSPCNRCLSLYEIDNFGFTQLERIPLTAVEELPAVTAHYVAAILAAQILHFIDQHNSPDASRISRNTGVGEITYINFQRLTEPQVVAIPRHPLCGCDR